MSENTTHLHRILEARIYYFQATASVIVERQTDPPNCLAEELLDRWADVRSAAKQAETDVELLEAAQMAFYGCATADHLLGGNDHAAIWTLTRLCESCDRFGKERNAE